MSWDILVHAATTPPPLVEDMTDDWKPLPLGSKGDVQAKVSAAIPGIRWGDDGWGDYEQNSLSLEFDLAGPDPLDGFMIHIRGGGDPIPFLKTLSDRYGWYLLDHSAGEWVHHNDRLETSWAGFQQYRDQVIATEKRSSGIFARLNRWLFGASD